MDKTSASYTMTITKDEIISTDQRFSMDNLSEGDNYKPINVYFERSGEQPRKRNRNKNEKTISNQTLPRLAFEIFEENINNLTDDERKEFPICRYKHNGRIFKGIYKTIEDAQKNCKLTRAYLVYSSKTAEFVIHTWNIFSTLLFVQECMKRFGADGDKFIVEYRDKTEEDQ